MNNQIKLAELIGWKVEKLDRVYGSAMKDGRYGHLPHMSVGALIPDPFIDANADYNILLWAREKRGIPRDVGTRYQNFMSELRLLQMKRDEESSILHEAYEIGDNAHAVIAMGVLK